MNAKIWGGSCQGLHHKLPDGQIDWLVLDLCDSQGHFCTAPLTVFPREPSNVNAFKNVGCHNALRTGFPDQKQWLHVAARFRTC